MDLDLSDTIDKVEKLRRNMIKYNADLADFKIELDDRTAILSKFKKERILKFAKTLEESGFDKEKISAQICRDLKDRIHASWIRKVLGDDYKERKFANIIEEEKGEEIGALKSASKTEERNPQSDLKETNKKLLISTTGEIINQELENIYGDKNEDTYEFLKKKIDEEIRGDKEETLENPHLLKTQPEIMLSNKSEYLRTLEARVLELEEALKEQAAIAKDRGEKYFNLKRQTLQNSDSVLKEENTQLKALCNNYQTLLADMNETVKAELGYKEYEITKLDKNSVQYLLTKSKDSEKTFVIFIHPKTGEIKQVMTDKEYHQFVARREYEKEGFSRNTTPAESA